MRSEEGAQRAPTSRDGAQEAAQQLARAANLQVVAERLVPEQCCSARRLEGRARVCLHRVEERAAPEERNAVGLRAEARRGR